MPAQCPPPPLSIVAIDTSLLGKKAGILVSQGRFDIHKLNAREVVDLARYGSIWRQLVATSSSTGCWWNRR